MVCVHSFPSALKALLEWILSHLKRYESIPSQHPTSPLQVLLECIYIYIFPHLKINDMRTDIYLQSTQTV